MFVRTRTHTFPGGGRVTITTFGHDPGIRVERHAPRRERKH